jgi:hypothetical protein
MTLIGEILNLGYSGVGYCAGSNEAFMERTKFKKAQFMTVISVKAGSVGSSGQGMSRQPAI